MRRAQSESVMNSPSQSIRIPANDLDVNCRSRTVSAIGPPFGQQSLSYSSKRLCRDEQCHCDIDQLLWPQAVLQEKWSFLSLGLGGFGI